jgi:hypothetical protein
MKRIVDIYTSDWSPEVVWTYVVDLEGTQDSAQLNHHVIDIRAFEDEALRLAIEDGLGNLDQLVARARE